MHYQYDPVIRISSKYPLTCLSPFSKLSMTRWKMAGADVMPKHNLLYWNNPRWALIVVYGLDSFDSGICKYAFDQSSVVDILLPAKLAYKSSIRGIG